MEARNAIFGSIPEGTNTTLLKNNNPYKKQFYFKIPNLFVIAILRFYFSFFFKKCDLLPERIGIEVWMYLN